MRISESTFTVGSSGALKIPSSILCEMGLFPGDHVRVAYLTNDDRQNSFREFWLSPDPLDELSDDQQFRVPSHILEDANIPADSDLQIACLDGCIVICRDPALNPNELASVLEQLRATDELTSALSDNPEQVREQIEKLISRFEEGEDQSEV